jgi:hypothetical protein
LNGLILPGQYDNIARSVQEGDPVVGWRGDPTMDVMMWHNEVHVYAFDREGTRYLAAATDARLPGWQHDLLRRLRDGDWQTSNAYDRVAALNAELERERESKLEDRKNEVAEKLARATRRDLGHLYSGTTKEFH